MTVVIYFAYSKGTCTKNRTRLDSKFENKTNCVSGAPPTLGRWRLSASCRLSNGTERSKLRPPSYKPLGSWESSNSSFAIRSPYICFANRDYKLCCFKHDSLEGELVQDQRDRRDFFYRASLRTIFNYTNLRYRQVAYERFSSQKSCSQ